MEPDYDIEHGFMQDDHYCVHGTYLGGWAGPDYMCGLCESGCHTLVRFPKWTVTWVHKGRDMPYQTTHHSKESAETEVERLRSDFEGVLDGRIEEHEAHAWVDTPDPDDEVLGTFYSRQQLREYEEGARS